jgi:hypothetical protein
MVQPRLLAIRACAHLHRHGLLLERGARAYRPVRNILGCFCDWPKALCGLGSLSSAHARPCCCRWASLVAKEKAPASSSDSAGKRWLCQARNSGPSFAPPTAPSSTATALSSLAHCAPDGSAAVLPVITSALAPAHRSDKRCPTTPMCRHSCGKFSATNASIFYRRRY